MVPKRWYRLTLTILLCITWVLGVVFHAPADAWLPFGMVGVAALGGSIAEHLKKKEEVCREIDREAE